MAFETLNKNLGNASGPITLDGDGIYWTFSNKNTSLAYGGGSASVEQVKNGTAKAELERTAKNAVRNSESSIQFFDKKIAAEQAIIGDPNSNSIQIDGAKRRLAIAQENKSLAQNELAGAQSLLSYATSGFQSDLDSLASKIPPVPESAPPGNDGTATGSDELEEVEVTGKKVQEPDADPESATADNATNDDGTPPSVPGENQGQEVLPESGQPTSVSAGGSGQGTSASPGPSGTSGADIMPGRRTYNPLSKLSSSTYNITLYMITPDAYDAFIQSGRKKIDAFSQASPIGGGGVSGSGAFIIAQSGGINNKTQTRAPGFELDYYIDNVSFTMTTSQSQTLAAAFTGSLKMTITEPYGFSFLSNLRRALDGLKDYSSRIGYKEMVNYMNQFFIIGVRFYGYDKNGNYIKGSDLLDGDALDPENGTNALFEKFFDVTLVDMKFQLQAKGSTQYDINFGTTNGRENFGTKRGRVQTGARVIGTTVKDMLKGTDGLLTKLNKEQEEQVSKKVRKLPNTYDVKFMGEAEERIGAASMVLDSDLLKYRWPGSKAESTSSVNDNVGIKAIPDSNSRELIFNNDTMIIRAISNIIMKSQFMEKALQTVYNNVTQPDPKQKGIQQTKNDEPQKLSWFNISAEITDCKWDTDINDWAYKTTYVITLYEIPSISTPFSRNTEKYYGPHKYFYYWLSGKNTEVIDFSLTFNNAYYNTVVTPLPDKGAGLSGLPEGTNAGRTAIAPMTMSGGDSTGSLAVGGQAQAAVQTVIQDPGAFTNGKITILGDPDFLLRDSTTSVDSLYQKFYDSDQFTVSAAGGLVYVEVVLYEAQDYQHSTGLQKVNRSIQLWPYPASVAKVAKGIIYRVDQVTSNFAAGKFTQTLVIRGADEWPSEDVEAASTGETREDQTDAGPAQQGTDSGATSGAGTGTTNDPGLLREPDLPKEQISGLENSQPLTNTIGNETQGTIDTDTGLVADDDSLSDTETLTISNTISNEQDNGREFTEEFTLQTRVKVDITGPTDI